jgi:hypothetical protein
MYHLATLVSTAKVEAKQSTAEPFAVDALSPSSNLRFRVTKNGRCNRGHLCATSSFFHRHLQQKLILPF